MSLIKVDKDNLITACDKAIAHHKSKSEPLLEKVKHHADEVERECRRLDSLIGCLDKIEGYAKDRAREWYKKELGDTVTERCGFLFLNQRAIKLSDAEILTKSMDYFLLENTEGKFVTLPIEIEDSENDLTHNLDVAFIHGKWYVCELCEIFNKPIAISQRDFRWRNNNNYCYNVSLKLNSPHQIEIWSLKFKIRKLEAMKTYANHNDFYLSSDEYGLIKGFL